MKKPIFLLSLAILFALAFFCQGAPLDTFWFATYTNTPQPGIPHFMQYNLNTNGSSSNLITDGAFILDAPGGIFLEGPISGAGTNLPTGEIWASDFGFSPTNTDMGNSNALNRIILVCSNMGGGIIRYGARGPNASPGSPQTIQLAGEHLFPYMPGSRMKLKGDGSTIIQFTGAHTTNAVLAGQFEAENLILYGPGTNIADTYPFTNSVGLYVGWNFDPHLKDCLIKGFGQGIAMGVAGAFRGALFEGVDVEACDIGYAFGGEDDQTKLIYSAARGCLIGVDEGSLTPCSITNYPPYNSFTGSVGTSVNTTSMDISVYGGIWDYNQKCVFMIGKGSFSAYGAYSGWENVPSSACFVISPHPNWVTSLVPYSEDGSTSIRLNQCFDYEANTLKTNIWLIPSSANPYLDIRGGAYGLGSGYGIVGEAGILHYDNVFNVGTNYMISTSVYFNTAPFDSYTIAGSPTTYHNADGGSYSGTVYNNRMYRGFPAANNITAWNWQTEDGSMSKVTSWSMQMNGATNDQFTLYNSGITLGGSGGQDNAVLSLETNSTVPFPMAGYSRLYLSNYDLYLVTPTKTNLVVLGH